MPAGDSINLDNDNDDDGGGINGNDSSRSRASSKQRSKVTGGPAGEVIDAEFRDLKS
jgi:hypothetical protein